MNTPTLGIAGQTAPELRVADWLANVDGQLRLADIDAPIIYLYNFQSWCPGCHSHGFPTLRAIRSELGDRGLADRVKFIAVQTVFEGHETNTPGAALESLTRHGLDDLALGHDVGDPSTGEPPTVMADYRTGGTPWTVIIGPRPDRMVLFDGFQLDADDAVALIDELITQHDRTTPTDRPPRKNEHMTTHDDTSTSTSTSNVDDLRERLTPQQFDVTQNGGTERPFSGTYWDTKTPGEYRCIVCDDVLFDSDSKYDSGTGWPSFNAASGGDKVRRIVDRSHGMVRTEARCNNCDAHLGHVFPDGPGPDGERFCMNSASLRLEPADSDS